MIVYLLLWTVALENEQKPLLRATPDHFGYAYYYAIFLKLKYLPILIYHL